MLGLLQGLSYAAVYEYQISKGVNPKNAHLVAARDCRCPTFGRLSREFGEEHPTWETGRYFRKLDACPLRMS